jgi:hypothetical protein
VDKRFLANLLGTLWLLVAVAGYCTNNPSACAVGGALALLFFLLCPPNIKPKE